MRFARWTAALATAILALAACGDGPAEPPTPTIAVRLCLWAGWVAIRNEGGAWIEVPHRNGAYEFTATERVAIATSRLLPENPALDVLYVTAAQAQAYYACTPPGTTPSGSFTGVVVGLGEEERADITYGGGSSASVSWLDSTFTAYVLPGANDLVATRMPPYTVAEHVDKAVIRRAQSYTADTAIALDFDAAEAFALAEHALRWTGPYAHVQVNFHTASGNNNVLQYSYAGEQGSGEVQHDEMLYSIPGSRLMPGDMHELHLSSDQRTVTLYYHQPQDRTLAFGPPGTQPTFTTLATSPRYRFRVDVPAQPEYGARILLVYLQRMQPGMTSRSMVTIQASREYVRGTPGLWSLEVPDLRGLDGLPDWVDLPSGEYEWGVYTSSAWDLTSENASDGTLVRSAWVDGTRAQ